MARTLGERAETRISKDGPPKISDDRDACQGQYVEYGEGSGKRAPPSPPGVLSLQPLQMPHILRFASGRTEYTNRVSHRVKPLM